MFVKRLCLIFALSCLLACNLAGRQALRATPSNADSATSAPDQMTPAEVVTATMTTSATLLKATPPQVKPTHTPASGLPRGAVLETVLAGTIEGEIDSSGVGRHYRLHIPREYQPGAALPLVINLHGLSSNSEQQEILSSMSAKADIEGFLVVYPDGLDRKWSVGPGAAGKSDLQFIRDLIQQLQKQYSIDPKQIYATGISNGGGMANRLGCDLSDLIAAIAPVSGAYLFWQDCHASRPVPVLGFHGTGDAIVPYGGTGNDNVLPPVKEWASDWASRNACQAASNIIYQSGDVTGEAWEACQEGASVVLYTIEGGGHTWPGSPLLEAFTTDEINATDIIWEFFKAHPMP